jgi:RNA polymerase sigma factor (sigma-70 family)
MTLERDMLSTSLRVTLARIISGEQNALRPSGQIQEWDLKKDDELLSTVAHGTCEERRPAFDAFYRRHSEYLYGVCYKFATSYETGFFDYEDIFQDTMAKAYEHAAEFRAEGITDAQELVDRADAWLGGIARRVAADYVRRKPLCFSVDPQTLEEHVDEPESSKELAEDAKLIRDAVSTLSQSEQAVIWATSQFYQRRKHQRTPSRDLDEIAATLNISRDAFRKIKQRARNKIFKYIANHKVLVIK